MKIAPLLTYSFSANENQGTVYLIGIIITLLILGYLIYTLVKPEKF